MSSRIDGIRERSAAHYLIGADIGSTLTQARDDVRYLLSQVKDGGAEEQLIQDLASFPFDVLMDENAPRVAMIGSVSTLRHMQARAQEIVATAPAETSARCGEAWRIVREIAKTHCYHEDSRRIGAPERCGKENWWCLSCRAKDLIDDLPVTPLPNSEEFKTIRGEVITIPFGTRQPAWIAACAIHTALEKGDIREIIAPEQYQEIILRNLSKCVFPASTEADSATSVAQPTDSHKHNCPNCFYFFDCTETQCATDYSASCPECDKKLDGVAQPETCAWSIVDGWITTSCGENFVTHEDCDEDEHGMKFCAFCGHLGDFSAMRSPAGGQG